MTFITSTLPVLAFASFLCAGIAHAQAPVVRYVNDDAPAGGNGLTWGTAWSSLDSALSGAPIGAQIWVATGTYRPRVRQNAADPRSVSFVVRNQLQIFGGFNGTETALSQRAGLFMQTILSGDIGVAMNSSDNAYHVVSAEGVSRLDGFLIQGGNANIAGDGGGGGIFCRANTGCNLTLAFVTLMANAAQQGGGIYSMLSTVNMSWCSFVQNTANTGGALYAMTATNHVWNTSFYSNESTAGNGGAVFLSSIAAVAGIPNVRFMNCVFHANKAAGSGGAAYLGGSQFSSGQAQFGNCSFAKNQATTSGGGIFAVTTSPTPAVSIVQNSILWDNIAPTSSQLGGTQTVSFSDVQGGVAGTGNLNVDPKFYDIVGGKLKLLVASPCIDAGSNGLILPDAADVDQDGNTIESTPLDLQVAIRILSSVVDMGAYEGGV